MSISLKIIHPCNHIVTKKEKKYGKIKMVRDFNIGFPDKLPANIQILRIDSIENKEGIEYTKLVDYEQKVSKDIIEWINPQNNPLLGETYFINALYIKTSTEKFEASECERCVGNGWYVNIFNENLKYVEGIDKLVQDFIKILFTEENEDNYGSNIRDVLAKNVYDEIELGVNVSASIESCADRLRKIQQSYNSNYINQAEMLDKITVYNVIFDREECFLYISIGIKSMSKEIVDFTFKI